MESRNNKEKLFKIANIGIKGIPVRSKGGGIELFVYQIGKILVKKGYKILAYVRKWYQLDISQNVIDGIEIICTPSCKIGIFDPIFHTITSTLNLLLNKTVRIIHLHGYVSYFAIPILKIFGKKTIITLHGNISENVSYSWIQKLFLGILINIGVVFADIITTVSKEQYSLLQRQKRKVYFTPYGVEPQEQISPDLIIKKYDLVKNNFLLFIGRIEKVKRVDWLIKAYQALNLPYKLVIAGDSSDIRYLKYCKSLAQGNIKIIFTGFVDGRIKEELLSNCLIFILPSISEGMPTALLEAMSYGKACLVTDIPSLGSIIKEGKNGFLYNGTYEDFEIKLNEILNFQKDKIAKIGENAKLFVEKNFSLTATVEIFEKIYQEMMTK